MFTGKWKLSACRAQADLTIRDMAQLLGVTTKTYQNWEKGKGRISVDAGYKLSKIFDIPMDLIDFTTEGNTPRPIAERKVAVARAMDDDEVKPLF